MAKPDAGPTLPTLDVESGPGPLDIPLAGPVLTDDPPPAENGAPKPKRKYRRREPHPPAPGPELPSGPSDQDKAEVGEACAFVFQMIFQGCAKRWGEHWALTPDDYARLKEKWGNAIAPFLSEVDSKWIALGAAIGGTGFMVLDRVQASKAPAETPEPPVLADGPVGL